MVHGKDTTPHYSVATLENTELIETEMLVAGTKYPEYGREHYNKEGKLCPVLFPVDKYQRPEEVKLLFDGQRP